MKNFFKYSFLIIIPVLVLGLAGCQKPKEAADPISLEYWRTFDNTDDLEEVINQYQLRHTNISIEVKKFTNEEFETKLLNALAEDRGPDMFSIPNTWVRKYISKIEPMPASTTLEVTRVKGGFQKSTYVEVVTYPGFNERTLRNTFVEGAIDDIYIGNELYGLPYYVDTLALFYNKQLLTNVGILEPANNWNDFGEQVQKTTVISTNTNQVLQAGAALGTFDNISSASDLLILLMMQNGTPITDEFGRFTLLQTLGGRRNIPAVDALNFYNNFANPGREVYTWNNQMPQALESFIQGRLAFFFGYSYHIPQIKAQAPKLRFGVAPFPQISGNPPVTMASFQVEVVSNKSENLDAAWNFLQFASSQGPDKETYYIENYLNNTGRPAAIIPLVAKQQEDVELGVFADQLISAKTWYTGFQPEAIDVILKELINDNLAAVDDTDKLLSVANTKLNQTLEKSE